MCELLEVSTSGYYEWASRAPSDRALSDAWLTEKIKEIHEANRDVYGAPRIHAELRLGHGIRVGRTRVERLMRDAGLSAAGGAQARADHAPRARGPRRRRPRAAPVSPQAPDVLWIADLTYLRTWEGWLYLAAVQDAYSRRIVGWSMADHMRHELVVDALTRAVARRRPAPGLIHHSDQGSQYVSLGSGQACAKAGISRSMGSRRDCWDNAVAETFFATSKRSWSTAARGRPARS